ncbi:Hint domain-containing protein [Cyanobium sp. NIES-981]|uniref:Hint domain-containing protein n=1 Tax=Cyanobium sp. NIES-981 TaxID=1851505 RepID=UPI0007DCDEAF|nr:Hint domain-containing protein [Cyanobium sp. NIES-981]SBO44420.1 protein of unknown function [Cyanobium sp. NIES-981]
MTQLLLAGTSIAATSHLEMALQRVNNRLQAWASNTHAYNAHLLDVFGAQSSEATSTLQASLSGAGLGIRLEILDGSTLSGINAAYTSAAADGTERIYLNATWLQNATAVQIEAVLLEELGHAIDSRLNSGADTPGDEGEIFSARLRGTTPATTAFTEDDQQLINLNGQNLMLEAAADTTPPRGSFFQGAAFAAPSTNPFGITDVGRYASPALADADGDGDLDLFIGNSDGNTLFFRNTASPGATAPSYAAASTNPFGISDVGSYAKPAFADADGDGDLDLFIGNKDGNTLFFRNTASPGATAPSYAAASTNPFGMTDVGYFAKPAFADADGDGDLDLFIGNKDGNTLFFRNTASLGATAPAFDAPSTNPFGITDVGSFASPAFADADGDGDLDLFIGNSYGNTLFFRNTASPGATAPAFDAPSTNPFGITGVGASATPAFADADGDGDLDLFIGNGNILDNNSGNTLFFSNTASPTAPVSSTTANGTYGPGSIITLTVQFSEAVLVTGTPLLQLETGAIDRFATYTSGSGTDTLTFSYTVQPGDISADLDQLSANALSLNGGTIQDAAGNNAILTLAQPGTAGSLGANADLVIDTTAPTGSFFQDPAYAAPSTNPFGISDVGSYASPALADADGDGDLDLFIGNSDGNTLFFRNTANPGATAPAFDAPSTNPFGITDVGASATPAFADADADGDLDLFIGNKDGNTLFFRNTASPGATAPSYAAASTNPFGITDVGYFAKPAFADADGDGDLDLFIGNKDGNTLFFRNTASPGATAPAFDAPSTNPFGITDVGYQASPAFADADGDGDLDLFIRNSYGNTLFFRNTASPGATAPAFDAPSTNPFGITAVGSAASPALADADGDGDLDLFIGNKDGNTLFFRNTASPGATALIAPVNSTTPDGTYGPGSIITLTVQFSEAVLVTGTPLLQLETGAIDRFATYTSGSGTDTLTFSYTVQPGDISADLDQLSANALTLNGGTIQDAAGNNAILTLAQPGAPGSLAANADIEVTCFLPGTLIATPGGEQPIETLQPGDLICTPDGPQPVKFVCRTTHHPVILWNLDALPICIKAGALGDGLPRRDLYVSGGHALLLDGHLIHASALVNGSTILQTQPEDWDAHRPITYYNIELEKHELITAEGLMVESFFDSFERSGWDNYPAYLALYGSEQPLEELPLPRVKFKRQLSSALRQTLTLLEEQAQQHKQPVAACP